MLLPFHPSVVHLPIVISFILPILILIFSLMIKKNAMGAKAWIVILGLQIFTTGTGYLALETGEVEEDVVERIVAKKLIGEHEEAAELFVGSTVIALVLGISAFFIRREFQFKIQMALVLISFISAYLAFRAGKLGGELVYKHGAAQAYSTESTKVSGEQEILPNSGKNTSESLESDLEEEKENSPDEEDFKDED
jgi:uncharacterized membrane protein